jgi:hypothetical protein
MNPHPFRPALPTLLRGHLTSKLFMLLAFIAFACSKESDSDDPCCKTNPLPQGAEIKSGQGSLQVNGKTDEYFYVLDLSTGEQIGYQKLNATLPLHPGSYRVKLNNSLHLVTIKAGMQTQCGTGTLMVKGSTAEYYYVLDSTQRQLAYEMLNKATSYFASPVLVKINNTQVGADVKLDELAEIQTGTILVSGTTDDYYYILNQQGTQLCYNKLGEPVAILPDTYTVKVNNSLLPNATVNSNQVTQLHTGTILVKGLTGEYYYVLDTLGTQLNYQTLNKPLSFFPGGYRIKVNNSYLNGKVAKSQLSEFETGSLVVNGNSSDYYYVLDANATQLHYNALNKPLSFFPAEYAVRLGNQTQKALIKAGQQTQVAFK